MKTLFLKIGMPVAAAVLAIAGAFATASMQSSSKSFAPKVGYTYDMFYRCDIAVACSDVPSQFICRYMYPNGPFAYGKTPQGECILTLWKPVINP